MGKKETAYPLNTGQADRPLAQPKVAAISAHYPGSRFASPKVSPERKRNVMEDDPRPRCLKLVYLLKTGDTLNHQCPSHERPQ